MSIMEMESRFFGWDQARLYLSWRTGLGLASFLLVAFSTGDVQAKMVARHKPATLAAMEGRFQNGPMTEITLIGQSNV